MRTFVLLLVASALVLTPASLAAAKGKKGKPGVPDKELKKRIDEAIERGAAWIRKQQKVSGRLAVIGTKDGERHGIGGTALAGLALLAAGDKKGDAVVDKAMEYCRREDERASSSRMTYDTGVLLMFVTKYYGKFPKPKKPKSHTREAKPKRNPCQLPEDIREWIRSLANFLVDVQKDTGDWGYPANKPDFSNTQYALLGLRAAKDCGIPIPPQVFKRTVDRALARQEQDGPEVPRILREKERTYVVGKDKARGWPYQDLSNSITGSMTTAGIAILQIAHDGLLRPRKFPGYKPSQQLKVAQAIQDGFAWLDKNFAVDKNPGQGGWHYYYLYGLERAAVLGGRDLIGQHDWYIDGAKYLTSHQQADGRWSTGELGPSGHLQASDMIDTAWAILFLKRATRPLIPLPAPVVTK